MLFYQNSPIFRHAPYMSIVVNIRLFMVTNVFCRRFIGEFSFFWFSFGVLTVGVEIVRM